MSLPVAKLIAEARGDTALGVQLGYVSQQLGHAHVAVTARHYARWCGGDVYREPIQLALGEVPADFLARVVEEDVEHADRAESHDLPHDLHDTVSVRQEAERAATNEKPRGVGDFDAGPGLERETGFEPATLGLGSRCSTN